MDLTGPEDVAAFLDQVLVANHYKPLARADYLVIQAAWLDQTYEEATADNAYQVVTLKKAGSKLWSLLTQIFGQEINKRNFRAMIQALAHTSGLPPLIGSLPDISRFYGRQQELDDLHQCVRQYRTVIVAGAPGIGKRSLVSRYIQSRLLVLPFASALWKSVVCYPDADALMTSIHQSLSVVPAWDAISNRAPISNWEQVFLFLQAHPLLLIFAGIDDVMEGDRLPKAYAGLFQRLIEDTTSNVILTSNRRIPELEALSVRGLPITTYVLGGLNESDAAHIFTESGLQPDQENWSSVLHMLWRNPLLLRQFSMRIREQMNGQLDSLNRVTVCLRMVEDWFEELFFGSMKLDPGDQQVLIDLARLLNNRRAPISTLELISTYCIPSATLERLEQAAFLEISVSPTQEKLIGLSPILQKYLMALT